MRDHSPFQPPELPTPEARKQSQWAERLAAAPFLDVRDGVARLKAARIEPMRQWASKFHSPYDLPIEYPATEAYLAALIGDADAFAAFTELVSDRACQNEVARLSPLNRKDVLASANPVIRHDFGRGLPEGVRPAFPGRKLLFVGGGGRGQDLLGRYYSQGATAVNTDPRASGFKPPGQDGPEVDRRAWYNEDAARELDADFGRFDAVVIQNVFDGGSVDTPEAATEILRGLGTSLSETGIAVVQIDAVGAACRKAILSELERQGLEEVAKIEVSGGSRGTCGVYARKSRRELPRTEVADASTVADMDEQAMFLREAFASNRANALGGVNMEIRRQGKIVDGLHPDERLSTVEERAKAAYRLERYKELKAEFEKNNS